MSYDYTIVGAGLFGATVARELTDKGKKCLVVERREYVGGNCHTREVDGIQVHWHGPHSFHTNDEGVWRYVNRFAEWTEYQYRVKSKCRGELFGFPINLETFDVLYGASTPDEANRKLDEMRVPCEYPANFEEAALAAMGADLYFRFVHGYTAKQWGCDPSKLPASLMGRVPIRMTWDDRYFTDRWQGVPADGYTAMIDRMLDGIEVKLGEEYKGSTTTRLIWTGCIDEFFGHVHGELEYRSLRFDHERRFGDAQGIATINYPDAQIPYTRTLEHKHYGWQTSDKTVVTTETPCADGEPYYPMIGAEHRARYEKYAAIPTDVIFAGRCGSYRYVNMDETVRNALDLARGLV